MFNHGMEIATLSSDLQSIACGVMFNQEMANVTLLSGSTLLCDLQSITCGVMFNHGMANVTLSSGLTLPSDLQSITFGLCSTTARGTRRS